MRNRIIFPVFENFRNPLLKFFTGFILLFCASGCSEEVEKIKLVKQKRKISLIAHRGASAVAPENTLAAIKKALDSPADFIEIDVHQTKDQQVVLMHDISVNRTTNGEGDIAELTLAEIKKLDAGSWFDSAFVNERVPTLEEVLQLVKGKKQLLIEVKKGDDFYEGIEANILALLQKYQAQNWCVVQSFYDPVLEKFWKNEFEVPTHKLLFWKMPYLPIYFDNSFRWGNLEKYYRAKALNINHHFASKSFIKYAHANGYKTFAWAVDDPGDINQLVDIGIDGIMSNAVTTLVIEK